MIHDEGCKKLDTGCKMQGTKLITCGFCVAKNGKKYYEMNLCGLAALRDGKMD